MKYDLGRVNLDNMAKAGNPPMKHSKTQYLRVNLCMQCLTSHCNAHGHLWASCLGLCERACHTDSACRTTVGGKLNEVLATR
jgi:hypothetical protein